VCRARDRHNNEREVAVKKIKNVLQSAELAKKTLREIYILKRMRHPNLIHMYDVHFHQTPQPVDKRGRAPPAQLDAYVVLDIAQGDLWEQTKDKPVTPGEVRLSDLLPYYYHIWTYNPRFYSWEVRLVMQGILEALRFLKETRVLHRDLKPENVLIARGQGGAGTLGRPLVADFGLARSADRVQVSSATLYSSPQHRRNNPP